MGAFPSYLGPMQTCNRGILFAVFLFSCPLTARVLAQEMNRPETFPAPSAPSSQTVLLSPPPSDGPLVVQAGFQLLDINQFDNQSETFEFSGILTARWKDSRQAFDPPVEGVKKKFLQGDYQFN